MKKSARRTLSLALSLVLICALAAVAFATSPPYYKDEDYDDRYLAQASASISRYGANGNVYVEEIGTGSLLTGYLRHVSMDYSYVKVTGNQAELITDSITDSTTSKLIASVAFHDASIQCMVNATFYFEAYVPTSYGTQRFTVAPVTLVY